MLLRGGITIGDFFGDSVMVWGKALLRAYELESKLANFPRIIFDPNVLKSFFNSSFIQKAVKKGIITTFKDDKYFLNYLYYDQHCNSRSFFEFVCKQLETVSNDRIKEKLLWHKEYLVKFGLRGRNNPLGSFIEYNY